MDKLIISDTSCLIALQNIGSIDVLKDLYREILITKEVKNEWGADLPEWIIVKEVRDRDKQIEIEERPDAGKASSIAFTLETNNSMLIINKLKEKYSKK